MGEQEARTTASRERRAFVQPLLDDLRALERLNEEGRIETGVRRIGAEQEMFLVDDSWRPCPRSAAVLSELEG